MSMCSGSDIKKLIGTTKTKQNYYVKYGVKKVLVNCL